MAARGAFTRFRFRVTGPGKFSAASTASAAARASEAAGAFALSGIELFGALVACDLLTEPAERLAEWEAVEKAESARRQNALAFAKTGGNSDGDRGVGWRWKTKESNAAQFTFANGGASMQYINPNAHKGDCVRATVPINPVLPPP